MRSLRSARLVAATLVAVTGSMAPGLAVTPAAQASGTTTLQDMQTGRCVDSNTPGTAYTLPCSGSGFQEWAPTAGTEGSVRYVVLVDQASARCLDSNANGDVYTLQRRRVSEMDPHAGGGIERCTRRTLHRRSHGSLPGQLHAVRSEQHR
jgi:hypothetical protein